ncbi:E3 ubiquitin-protein ligase CBL-C [Spea bombifrons]|uniref:E3 ubiquitin-protein ligase CBL-C n=1 Tax=Spea bombifrons TaxID=233779 RepID=UPI00234AA008|nr:E3 ubiquitin-protein ligase CBL-C [Spea bombifrons]
MSTKHKRSPQLDRRTWEKTLKELESVMKFRTAPQLHRSHPFIPDVVQAIINALKQILQQNLWSELSHNLYLQVTLESLLHKAGQCSGMLRQTHQGEGTLPSRRNLNRMSLIFSHTLSELKAIFPGGIYRGGSYQVVKPEAAKFWTQAFGIRCLIQWAEFKARLNSVHPLGSGPLESALRSTVDLTCNDHISVFEFDIFTRLFQPWDTLLQNWMLLAVTHPGYMAFQTYNEVRDHLQGHIHKPGTYIFRLSCTHLGQWAIGYVTSDGTILQTIIHYKSLYKSLKEGEEEGHYLYPNGLSENPDLSALENPSPNTVVNVTQEQWTVYSDMDFKLCKICTDKEKNIRIQPCGHLICDDCLTGWQNSAGVTCPFCRAVITGKEFIHLELQPELSATPSTQPEGCPIDPEEEDWIRNRPLPAPPQRESPSPQPPVPSRLSTYPPVPPPRIKIRASDIIRNQETPRGVEVANRIGWGAPIVQSNPAGGYSSTANIH